MDPIAHPIVRVVRDAIFEATGSSLVGLYVYGSLVTDDFEPNVSDIDLIAVLAHEPDGSLVAKLAELHAGLARAHPRWNDRIDVDYISAAGLANCLTDATTIARISPGEPLHVLEAGRDFLLDWYPARQEGVAVLGPVIDSLIPTIPEAEYLDEARRYLAGLADRFDDDASPGSQAYAILTMCRGLYSIGSGERLSKRDAASRVRADFPKWAGLIDRALGWRDRQWEKDQADGSATIEETRAFVVHMDQLLGATARPAIQARAPGE